MKKMFIMLGLLAFFPRIVMAQIPNASFENWTSNNGILEADGWQISSLEGAINVIRSDDGYDGTYSSEMLVVYDTVMGMNSGGFMFTQGNFAVSERYRSLKGYIKGNISGTDTLKINVSLWYQGTMIGYSFFRHYQNHSGWTAFSTGIDYITNDTPDEAFIAMQIGQGFGGNLGSWYRVDKLEFSDQPSGMAESGLPSFMAGPNPASGRIDIQRVSTGSPAGFILLDSRGRVVRQAGPVPDGGSASIDTGDLPDGLYLLRETRSGEAAGSQKIIIRHP
ncbi:MAG TPA: hypothetical protein PKG48_03670 [Bacteroidales bacterium]|nr:hypothetical protein [Bacteroidales bacterium]